MLNGSKFINMLIYVEGIDKAGKTTFITNFSRDFNIQIFKKTIPNSITLSQHHHYFKGMGFSIVELSKIFKFNCLIDRSFISDFIYSNRIKREYDLSIWREWENYHSHVDVIVLYFYVDEVTFKKRLDFDPDIYMNFDEYTYYTSLYEEYLLHTSLPYIMLNGSDTYPQQLANLFRNRGFEKYQSFFQKLDTLKR